MIDYRIRSFLVFAESGNFTFAAKHLHLSQPALSRQIQSLEKQIGQPLYHRNEPSFRLTDAGELLRRYGETMCKLEEQFSHQLIQPKNTWTIRYDKVFQNSKILDFFAKLALIWPDIDVRFVQESNDLSLNPFQFEDADLVLSSKIKPNETYYSFGRRRFCLASKLDDTRPLSFQAIPNGQLCSLNVYRSILKSPLSRVFVDSMPLLLNLIEEGYIAILPDDVVLDETKYRKTYDEAIDASLYAYLIKGPFLEDARWKEIISKCVQMSQTSFDMKDQEAFLSNNVAYLLDVSALEERFDILLPSLSEEEILRVEKMMKRQDQLLELGKFLLIRSYLGNGKILFQENGKPYLENGPHFSISHCFPYCVLFILNQPCGVDIERNDEKRFEFLAKYFNLSQEQGDFDLIERWTIKEGCYKASGVGYMDARQPLMEIDDSHVCFQGNRYCYQLLTTEDASVAFASPFDFDVPAIIEVNPNRYFG